MKRMFYPDFSRKEKNEREKVILEKRKEFQENLQVNDIKKQFEAITPQQAAKASLAKYMMEKEERERKNAERLAKNKAQFEHSDWLHEKCKPFEGCERFGDEVVKPKYGVYHDKQDYVVYEKGTGNKVLHMKNEGFRNVMP